MNDKFVINPKDFIHHKSFGSSLKDGILWLGRQIKLGFEKMSPYLKTAAIYALNFMRTPLGLSLVGAGISAIFLAVANSSWLEGDLNQPARVALKIVAVALFVVVGAGIAFVIMHGNAPLI